MKKRALALLMVLCMLTPMLPVGPAALSEEVVSGQVVEALPEVPVEEAPAEEAPVEEAPAEEAPDVEEAPAEEVQSAAIAFGSADAPYAGVTYISQAAYDSLSPEAQAAYDRQADEVNALLDRGVVLKDVVFAVQSDGSVASVMTVPSIQLYEEAMSATAAEAEIADFEEPEVTEPEVQEPEIVEPEIEEPEIQEPEEPEIQEPETEEPEIEEPEIAEPEAAEPEAQEPEAEATVIAENEDLLEAAFPPIQKIPGKSEPQRDPDAGEFYGAQRLDKLFTASETFFYNQLSDGAKSLFSIGYDEMIVNNNSGYIVTTTSTYQSNHVFDSISALVDTYPAEFDWANGGSAGVSIKNVTADDGTTIVYVSMVVSEHYSPYDERRALDIVQQICAEATAFANREYPANPLYGKIVYFDDWICDHAYYNNIGVSTSEQAMASEAYYYCHTSYGVLFNGYGVCESYALAMARLLDFAGIPNLYATGTGSGGGHAWNYVLMPDNKYYLLDSTWNDDNNGTGASTQNFLLAAGDSQHKPMGRRFNQGNVFSFPSLSSSRYSYDSLAVTLNKGSLYLAKGKSSTLKVEGGAFFLGDMTKYWSSSDKSVATVSSKGKVTAKKPGTAIITMQCAGFTATCTVYVYQIGGISFAENKKSSYSTVLDVDSAGATYTLSVNMKTSPCTAKDLAAQGVYAQPTVKVGNERILIADAVLSGNSIVIAAIPRSLGKTTITVKFAGKTAKLTLNVNHAIKDDWFALEYTSTPYTGSARKPKVYTTAAAAPNTKYKIAYSNNKNAGTATVKITGTGYYAGTIKKTFTITPLSILPAIFSRNPGNKNFNGRVQKPGVKVLLNGKYLKENKDFKLLYAYQDAETNTQYTDSPRDAHFYAVVVAGTGNYTGVVTPMDLVNPDALSYTIYPVPLESVQFKFLKWVSYNGKPVTMKRLKATVKIGKYSLTEGVDFKIQYVYPGTNYTVDDAPSARGTYTVCMRPIPNGNITLPNANSVKAGTFSIR